MCYLARSAVFLSVMLFTFISSTSVSGAPVMLSDRSPAVAGSGTNMILVSEKGKCIYRCRILREECADDNARQSRSDDVCWDAYATCRETCSDTSPVGGTTSSPPGNQAPVAEEVVLAPTIIVLGKWGGGIAYDGRWLWAAESGQRTVARIDLLQSRIVERFKVGRLPTDMSSFGNGNIFALVATDKKIWRRNQHGRSSTLARLGECPDKMISTGLRLWVLTQPECSSVSGRVIRIDPRTGRKVQSGILGEWAQALAAHGNQIWIAHARGGRLSIIDQDNLGSHHIQIPGASFWSITSTTRHIFAGGREGENNKAGLVVMLDPVTRAEVNRATLPEGIAKIASDGEYIVAISWSGVISIFSAKNLQLLRTIKLTTGRFAPDAVIFHEDRLLVSGHSDQGENGFVYSLANWLPATVSNGAPNPGFNRPTRPRFNGTTAPTFNCVTNRGIAEQAICNNSQLAALDRELSDEYSVAKSNITSEAVGGTAADVADFRREQRAWLRKRNRCAANFACLTSTYRARLRVLHEMNQPE